MPTPHVTEQDPLLRYEQVKPALEPMAPELEAELYTDPLVGLVLEYV
jgi:hypothetical protein